MKTLNLSRDRKYQSAFTLIEIMVATVVMIVLTGLVIQITSEVLKVWNRSSGKLSANAEARIAMDLLTQDLETAVFRNNGQRWLEARQLDLGDPLTGANFKTTELRVFSPALDRVDGPGDICGISYLLDYRNPIDGSVDGDRTFVLYRHLVDPKTTFENLMGEPQQNKFNNTEWTADSTRDTGNNYLVSNIVDFRVDFYVEEDGDSDTPRLVSGDVFFGGTDSTVGTSATSPAQAQFAKPLAYAEITLTIISDEVLSVIQNDVLAQTGFNNWREYISANSEVYTRRVNFLARPL
ncbi:MAG: prepilin-type N-terminal cleavage/methylation domain-containing protein [Verrucomicrobiota bacterium]|nr:prepilin-type N-terminal cleavage/methylation domain-containing protein [Verrucomicrobiota bacterium]